MHLGIYLRLARRQAPEFGGCPTGQVDLCRAGQFIARLLIFTNTEDLAPVWRKLRNTSAHSQPAIVDLQELFIITIIIIV